jgi:RNA polymerase sporulation-specific sigma factor
LRRTAGETTVAVGDEPYDLPFSKTADPAELLQQREEVELLHARMQNALTPVEYRVLQLYLASYSYREIAQHLNIDVKAVDNALQRLRKKLSRF